MMRYLMIATAMLLMLAACQTNKTETKNSEPVAAVEMTNLVTYTVNIDGMTCTGCEETIKGSVKKLEGIKSVEADFNEGKAFVEFSADKTDTTSIREAITSTGYTVLGFDKKSDTENPE